MLIAEYELRVFGIKQDQRQWAWEWEWEWEWEMRTRMRMREEKREEVGGVLFFSLKKEKKFEKLIIYKLY